MRLKVFILLFCIFGLMPITAQEWSYLENSVTVIGFPGMEEVVEVGPDGSLCTSRGELNFVAGKDDVVLYSRNRTWMDGQIPVVMFDQIIDGIRYSCSYFCADTFNDTARPVVFVIIKAENISSVSKSAKVKSSWCLKGKTDRFIGLSINSKEMNTFTSSGSGFYSKENLVYSFPAGSNLLSVPGTVAKSSFSFSGFKALSDPRCISTIDKELKPAESFVFEYKMPVSVVKMGSSEESLLVKTSAASALSATAEYWKNKFGGFNEIQVPETRVANTLRASFAHVLLATRKRNGNIIQTDGLPYPNLFVSAQFDYGRMYQAFKNEDYVKNNIRMIIAQQMDDGLFLDTSLIHGRIIFSSHGQALFALSEYILYGSDNDFKQEIFPALKKGIECIASYHKQSPEGLLEKSWPYDNEMISGYYTSHNLWSIAGLKSSIAVAQYLNKNNEETAWKNLLISYEKSVLLALEKSTREGNYIPTGLYDYDTGETARKGFAEYRTDQDWENVLLAWPTEVLSPDDLRTLGTANHFKKKYREGIMTYRNGKHLHQYITVNSSMQFLLAGDDKQALLDLYSIILHNGSTGEGFENMVIPWGNRKVEIDCPPPHAWGAAKIGMYVRNIFVMTHGGNSGMTQQNRSLYLFNAVSPSWVSDGQTIGISNAPTDTGMISTSLTFSGNKVLFKLKADYSSVPASIFVKIPWYVKNPAIFSSNGKSSSIENGRYKFSSDTTEASVNWEINESCFNDTFQDLLKTYRSELIFWPGKQSEMPQRPVPVLTADELNIPAQKLSFDTVLKTYQYEKSIRMKAAQKH